MKIRAPLLHRAPSDGSRSVLWLTVLVVLVPFLGYSAFVTARGTTLNLFEGGTFLHGGQRILQGQIPYRDFFDFYGPLTFYIQALFLAIGGVETPLSVFYLPWLLSLASILAAWALAIRLIRIWWIAALVPLLMIFYGGSSQRTLPPLLAALAVSFWFTQRGNRYLFATGVCIGVGLLWFQDAGAYMLLAVFVCLALEFRVAVPRPRANQHAGRSLLHAYGACLLGVAAVIVPVSVYFWLNGALGDALYYTLIYPNVVYTQRESGSFLSLIALYSALSFPEQVYKYLFYAAVFAFPPAVYLSGACVLGCQVWLRRWSWEIATLCALLLYGVAQYRLVINAFDDQKLLDVIAPAYIIGAWLGATVFIRLHSRLAGSRLRRPALMLTALVLVGLPGAYMVKHVAQTVSHLPTSTERSSQHLLDVPLAGVSPPATSVHDLDSLVSYVKTQAPAGANVFVVPFEPMLYVLLDRRNPTYFDYLDPYYIHAPEEARIITALQQYPPVLVIESDAKFASNGLTGPQIAPTLWRYLAEHYANSAVFGSFQVLAPRIAGSSSESGR